METFLAILPNLIVGVVVAVVTAYVTVRLSIRRFRAEQWWTQKAEAYTSIIEGLHDMRSLDTAYMREIERGQQMSKETLDSMVKKARDGYRQVRKAIDANGFLLCRAATDVLKTLDVQLGKADDAQEFYDHLSMSIDAVETCLAPLPDIAKRDLGVR